VRCEPRVIERLGRIFPLTYAVCPACRHRQGIEARTNEMTCDRCKKTAAMAWDELS
jgi:tRNA(Ile2) C34 agmatinyltransferase TiaS